MVPFAHRRNGLLRAPAEATAVLNAGTYVTNEDEGMALHGEALLSG